jgi:co-chaperonin GroES (HSP10)
MIPRHDRVLIQRIGDIEQIGSIYLPDSARERSCKGVVIATGPGKWHEATWWKVKEKWEWCDGWREQMDVRPGQTVLFSSKWNDLAADYDKELPIGSDASLHLVRQADIIGIIPDALSW